LKSDIDSRLIDLEQYGPTTDPRAACGPWTEFLKAAELSVVI